MNSTDAAHQRFHLGIVNVSTVPSEEVIDPMVCRHRNVQGIIRCLPGNAPSVKSAIARSVTASGMGKWARACNTPRRRCAASGWPLLASSSTSCEDVSSRKRGKIADNGCFDIKRFHDAAIVPPGHGKANSFSLLNVYALHFVKTRAFLQICEQRSVGNLPTLAPMIPSMGPLLPGRLAACREGATCL